MNYAIIVEHEVMAKSFELKKQVNPRVKKYRKALKQAGIKFVETFLPANTHAPDVLRDILTDEMRKNYLSKQALNIFSWE